MLQSYNIYGIGYRRNGRIRCPILDILCIEVNVSRNWLFVEFINAFLYRQKFIYMQERFYETHWVKKNGISKLLYYTKIYCIMCTHWRSGQDSKL